MLANLLDKLVGIYLKPNQRFAPANFVALNAVTTIVIADAERQATALVMRDLDINVIWL